MLVTVITMLEHAVWFLVVNLVLLCCLLPLVVGKCIATNLNNICRNSVYHIVNKCLYNISGEMLTNIYIQYIQKNAQHFN